MRRTAGFVLAGGRSSRMGRDKALAEYLGEPMLLRACRAVEQAAGSATIVGSPETYAHLGYPVLMDTRQGEGPLAGIEAALESGSATWNLVVACDMPLLDADFLATILEAAGAGGRSAPMCVMAESGDGRPEPLCAAYHRDLLPLVRRALDRGVRKVRAVIEDVPVLRVRATDTHATTNVNTPADLENLPR